MERTSRETERARGPPSLRASLAPLLVPDEAETSPGRASPLCGRPQPGCTCKTEPYKKAARRDAGAEGQLTRKSLPVATAPVVSVSPVFLTIWALHHTVVCI